MDTITQNIDLKNLDKSTWKSFRFDQIAKSVSERVDPNTTDLKIYVGLEHLDADNIHIKRKGTPADVEGQKLKCYPGDVIFGKRRAYQRKAAIADFEGICSAHAFVLRANPAVMDPNLFPFFLHSDLFMHRAIDISVGGLSPTINWGNLKEQEFLLPPKEEQALLAELLWAMDEVIEKEFNLLKSLGKLKLSNLKNIFSKENCIKVRVGEISENLDNRRIPIKRSLRDTGIYPYYGASGIVDYVNGYLFDEEILLISEDGENLISRNLPIAYAVDSKCWVNNHSHVLKITCASRYLVKEYFNFSDLSDFITGGTRPKITKGMLTDIPVYIPKVESVAETSLLSIDGAISRCENNLSTSKGLQKGLVSQIF